MTYYPRSEWGAQPSKRPLSPWTAPVEAVITHWEGVPYISPTLSQAEYAARVRSIQAYHLNHPTENYSDIAYNFLIDPLGNLYEGRGWDHSGAANGNSYWNAHGLAVCYLGGTNGQDTTQLTLEAQRAFKDFTRAAARRFPAVASAQPHSAVRDAGTACPGNELRLYTNLTLNALANPAPSTEDEMTDDDLVKVRAAAAAGVADALSKNPTAKDSFRDLVREGLYLGLAEGTGIYSRFLNLVKKAVA